METVTCIKPIGNHRIEVIFKDGFCADIDMRPFIQSKGISQPLNDELIFNTVKIDEAGGIVWSNGYDFCPVHLRQIACSC